MTPPSDAHGSAPYERELLRSYLQRAVRQAFKANGGNGAEGAAD